jgi:hypothetical protein
LAPITAETTIRRSERVVHAELRDETVLLDNGNGTALRLNPAGAAVWGALETTPPA